MAELGTSNGIDLTGAFGPVYIGFVISLLLGGITIVQAYMYFPHPTDSRIAQWTAASMLILDLVSSALVAQSLYYYLLPAFGSLIPFNSVTPELSIECLLSTIITFISQLYFVYQLKTVQTLQHKLWWASCAIYLITFFAILACAGGVACVTSMLVFDHGVLMNRHRMFAIFFGVAKTTAAVADVLATIALSVTLQSQKTSSTPNRTNMIIRTLIQYLLQRGILVTLIQVLLLVTFYAMPTKLVWFAFHVNVTKLYANTFFAMLNGRETVKNAASRHSVYSNTLTGGSCASPVNSGKVNLSRACENHSMEDMESQNHITYPTISVTKSVVVQEI